MHDRWAKPASSPQHEQPRTGGLPQRSASSSKQIQQDAMVSGECGRDREMSGSKVRTMITVNYAG
jgi:hypothetical protein